MQASSRRFIQTLKPLVPRRVKRPLKRAIPQRYHRFFDPDWHRRSIGNVRLWETLGQLQFAYLVDRGLAPQHYFLDVGCGPLRGGAHFIRYLESGHYYGVDKNAPVLEEVRRLELPRQGLAHKRPTLAAIDDFGFGRLGREFDFALAQSVFTHLPLNDIIRCVMEMEKALVPGGEFYATFFENERGKLNLDDVHQTAEVVTHFDRDFYHYDVGTFEWICDGTKLKVEYLGDWNNPVNQKMLVFRKRRE
ncbi:MAG: class I SAM-dependent methyltransferase [Gaiellaceae bacterium]